MLGSPRTTLDLRDIDRLSIRYIGEPHPLRDNPRVSAWIEIDPWHAWRPENIKD